MDPARIDCIRKLAAGWVDRGDTPSLVVLAARRGTIVLHEAFGVRRSQDTTATLKRDSIFPLASCSKPITAAAVMCLAEDGLIGLNRPVIDYVPEWDAPGVQWIEEMKVADLLCHTGGFEDFAVVAHIEANTARATALPPPGPGQHPKVNARIRLAAGVPLARRPGSAMMYCNLAFILLSDIVRRVSGQPFWRFVQTRLFEPLGMHDSSFVFPTQLRDRRVYRASGMPGTQPVPGLHNGVDSPEFDELDLGSTSAASTAWDCAVFMQMLLNGGAYGDRRVLSPASVRAMNSPQVDLAIPRTYTFPAPNTGNPTEHILRGGGYGFGMYLFTDADRFGTNGSLVSTAAFGHMGYTGAYFWADPKSEVVGVLLCVAPRLVHDVPDRNSDLFMNMVHAAIVD